MTEAKKWFAVKGQVVKFRALDFDWEVVKSTAGDECDWLPHYLKVKTLTGETYSNIAELRVCKLTKAKAVPWESDRSWDASFDDKREMLRELDPDILSQILVAFAEAELAEVDKKKV